MADTGDEILVDRSDDGVVTITLNRPTVKNAMLVGSWPTLRRAVDDFASDTAARVLVMTGADGNFCAGADAMDTPDTHALDIMLEGVRMGVTLFETPKPTIAKVRGDAIGVGMNLALACDLVVASETARFSQIFCRRGLAPDLGGTWILPHLVGVQKAKELAFFGDLITARDAQDLGIVNRVVSDDDLDAFVDDWAKRLAAGPPLALQMTKRLISNSTTSSLSEALNAEAFAQTVLLNSRDVKEGFAAFLQRREPKFEGR